jgi:hypothetical protein
MASPFRGSRDECFRPGATRPGQWDIAAALRVPIWHDEWFNPLSQGALLDFAIVWDEDHDDRVIQVIEALYFGGLLGPIASLESEREVSPC